MNRPRGALDTGEWRILRYAFPDKIIYRVSSNKNSGLPRIGMFHGKRAITWMYSSIPPTYYFDNYWFAYAYALKRGLKGEDLRVKIRR